METLTKAENAKRSRIAQKRLRESQATTKCIRGVTKKKKRVMSQPGYIDFREVLHITQEKRHRKTGK